MRLHKINWKTLIYFTFLISVSHRSCFLDFNDVNIFKPDNFRLIPSASRERKCWRPTRAVVTPFSILVSFSQCFRTSKLDILYSHLHSTARKRELILRVRGLFHLQPRLSLIVHLSFYCGSMVSLFRHPWFEIWNDFSSAYLSPFWWYISRPESDLCSLLVARKKVTL